MIRAHLDLLAFRLEPFRRALMTVLWLPIGFAVAMLLAAAAPLALGDHSFVVQSGSMTPTIRTGDVVVVEPIEASQARVGDIITFRNPDDNSELLTHRAVAIEESGKGLAITTQGDANSGRENWKIKPDGDLGHVVYRVPGLGFPVSWIGSPGGRIGLVVIPAFLLGLSLLGRIWLGGRGEDDDAWGADEHPA
jgi:signal peptidase